MNDTEAIIKIIDILDPTYKRLVFTIILDSLFFSGIEASFNTNEFFIFKWDDEDLEIQIYSDTLTKNQIAQIKSQIEKLL